MIHVVATPNPFEPRHRVVLDLPHGATMAEVIAIVGLANGSPVIAGVDGDWWLRARWVEPIADESFVQVEALVAGGGGSSTTTWISVAEIVVGAVILGYTGWTGAGAAVGYSLIIAGVAGLATSLLIHAPRLPSNLQGESGSPTYSLEMQNRKRVGEPIPVLYGRHRIVPDLAASPYFEYASNNQYLYSVMCLGQGEFEIESLRIADSPLDRLSNLTYQLVPPGATLDLFRDNVTTSTLVAGQTLRPTNEILKPGNIKFQFVTSGGINAIAQDPVTAGTFTGVAPGDSVLVTNCLNAGAYTISGVNGSSSQIFITHALITEHAKAAGLNFSAGGTDVPAGDVYFTASTRTITDPTKKRFLGWNPGDQITVSNTTSNDTTVTLDTIAGDGSWATVVETLVDESGANADLTLTTGGYIGPFPVNGWGTALQSIGIDIIFPRGLINNGASRSVDFSFEAREIDASGAAIGAWVVLDTPTITDNTIDPVRQSFEYAKPAGGDRWEVRVKRTSSSLGTVNCYEDVTWAGLRGYLPNVGTYAGVTMLAVRVRASEQIPADVAQQINIVATRMIDHPVAGDAPIVEATRNPAWALYDILTSTAYGAGLDVARIDMDKINALATEWADRGDYFDGVFDQTDTLWDALTKVARVGRAVPVLSGGIITFIRDEERTSRTALYAPHHMTKGSFGVEYTFRKEDDADGVQITYIDPNTWQVARFETDIDGGTPTKPAIIELFGVTDADQAQREALYLCRVNAYQRKVIHFTTELDGHIPMYGDRITISQDVASWGQSGHLLAVSGSGTLTLRTTEPLVWTALATHYIALRRPNGSLSGPFIATQVVGDDYACTIADPPLDFTPHTDLTAGDRSAYLFGPTTNWGLDVIITKISPRDERTVELTCQPYDARIYAAGT